MPDQILKKYEDLIKTGNQLVPLGGFEFSGYNARLQSKYLEWRKACLKNLDESGPIGFPYKQKILGVANSEFFFQSSAQLIFNCINELYEKLKASPDLASPPPIPAADLPSSEISTESGTGSVRVLKPPPKHLTSQTTSAGSTQAQVNISAQSNKVYVVGEMEDPLHAQLLQFLHEIELEEVDLEREHGKMLPLDSFQIDTSIKYIFFVINADDLAYAMFEIGHFVGKLGKNCVCVLHMSDVNFPKNVPGVLIKPIVVKLEEASFGILKDLKAAGYQINL
jgi:hypothetical protein